jgi:hypothetical protein
MPIPSPANRVPLVARRKQRGLRDRKSATGRSEWDRLSGLVGLGSPTPRGLEDYHGRQPLLPREGNLARRHSSRLRDYGSLDVNQPPSEQWPAG